jgi:hypothetical protein
MPNKEENIVIRPAGAKGKGVFAKRDFAEEETIYSFPKGRVVARDEIAALSKAEKERLDKIGATEYEIIEPPARYVNHSCDPNTAEKDHKGYALRPIEEGEEIAIDYDKLGYIEKPFACHCGSNMCRSIVRGKR